MSIYQKDKYRFSSNPALVLMGSDIIEERGRQALEFSEQLAEYGIVLKDLTAIDFDEAVRNEILNIAIYISESAELYAEMEEKKELPIKKISKDVLRTRKLLDSWKEYIIAYTLIIGSYKYKHLNDYLRIVENVEGTKDSKKVIHLKDIISQEEDTDNIDENESEEVNEEIEQEEVIKETNEIKGVILSKNRRKGIIMTSMGIFKCISIEKDTECGQEIEGKIKKTIKDYKKALVIISAMVVIVAIVWTYVYTNVVSTIVIEAGTSVRVEVNMLNRVVNIESATSEGDIIINDANVKDRDIDSAVSRIIKAAIDNGITTTDDRVLITVTGEAVKYGVLQETSKYIEENGIEVKFNNAGYQKKL